MKTILSTKTLSLPQKELLLNAGFAVVSYDAIKIKIANFTLDPSFRNLILTSQNAVTALLHNIQNEQNVDVSLFRCFCVGEKTAALLRDKGLQVEQMADYGSELAQIIVNSYQNQAFLFLCGNLRRDELPDLLRENNIECKEITVYTTQLIPKKFERHFDGVLFFSPSGVESYTSFNVLGNSITFCIGTSTAAALNAFSDKIVIANKPTIENVVVQVIKTFNNRPLESA